MRKFILRSILFLVLLFLIIFFLAGYDNEDKYSNNDHNVLKIAHLSAFDSLNILFLGNSFCYSSIYNPLFDSLGVRTFNLGIASAGPKFYSMLLEDYFSEVKRKPDTIMLLITPMTFSGKADNWIDYPMHRYLKKPLSNLDLVLKYRAFSDFLPMLINSARKGFNNIITSQKLNQREFDKIFQYRGLFIDSSITNKTIENSLEYLYRGFKNDRFNWKDAQLLMNIADDLKTNRIHVIFFETPTHRLKDFFSPEYLKDYDRFIHKISGNYRVIRANEMDSRYFRNIDHTNTQGAYRYTQYLLEKLYDIQN